jgi:hypothetical protein
MGFRKIFKQKINKLLNIFKQRRLLCGSYAIMETNSLPLTEFIYQNPCSQPQNIKSEI